MNTWSCKRALNVAQTCTPRTHVENQYTKKLLDNVPVTSIAIFTCKSVAEYVSWTPSKSDIMSLIS